MNGRRLRCCPSVLWRRAVFYRMPFLFRSTKLWKEVYSANVTAFALLTVIVYDELGSSRRHAIRCHVGGDEFQLDGAGVGHEDDLPAMMSAAGGDASPRRAVADHRHVVAGFELLRPSAAAGADERQQGEVDSLSLGRAHLPRARRRPDAGTGRHRARQVRRLVGGSRVVSRVTLVHTSTQHCVAHKHTSMFETRPGYFAPTKVYSAFHPSGVGK